MTGKKILIVDDDPINIKLFKIIAEKNNIEYDYATDGLKAKDMIDKNRYDLILLDIGLPGMNGFEIIEYIGRLNHRPKVIVVTAYAMKEDKNKVLQMGADYYLSKPIDVKELVEKINYFLSL